MDLRWQLIASLLRRGSQSINLGQWLLNTLDLNKIVLLSGPRCDITQRSVPHVETINNADVTKLLRSDRSSDTRGLLFYFIIIIIFYFYI